MAFITGGVIILALLQVCLSSVLPPTQTHKNDEKALLFSLLGNNYNAIDRMARPVEHDDFTLIVTMGLSLTSIESYDKKTGILDITGWHLMNWHDYQLTWNPEEHGNIDRVYIPQHLIWKPDILLYNKLGSAPDSQQPVNVVVMSDGTVTWVPPSAHRLKCTHSTTSDACECKLKFGSWVYDGNKVDLALKSETIDLAYVESDGEWEVTNTSAVRHAVTYDCCPEEYVDITYQLTLKERSHDHHHDHDHDHSHEHDHDHSHDQEDDDQPEAEAAAAEQAPVVEDDGDDVEGPRRR